MKSGFLTPPVIFLFIKSASSSELKFFPFISRLTTKLPSGILFSILEPSFSITCFFCASLRFTGAFSYGSSFILRLTYLLKRFEYSFTASVQYFSLSLPTHTIVTFIFTPEILLLCLGSVFEPVRYLHLFRYLYCCFPIYSQRFYMQVTECCFPH